MLEGAIFDMDGVLLDNLDYHLEAFLELGREEGKELTPEEVSSVFGRRNEDMLRILIDQNLSREETDRMADRKEALYRELISSHLEEAVVPGLRDFLAALAGNRIPLALATSGPRENVDFVFNGLEIGGYFRVAITGDQVTKGKPHPEVFLKAAGELHLAPEKCVVFEDSISGVQAALAAGCRCVALSTTHAREELEEENPYQIIPDFHRLRWEELC